MKLPLLLAQYLYQYKQLSLPGIGTFQFEGQVPEEKMPASGSVQFVPGTIKAFAPELVDFVKSHTGKMRTLAEADLDSYLIDIKEFINIGKPCFLEGIGTLTKNRDGSYDFVQGAPVHARIEEVKTTLAEKAVAVHEKEYYSETPSRSTMRTLVVGIAIIAGIGLIGWGGYFFYKQYEAQNRSGKMPEDSIVSAAPVNETDAFTPEETDSTALPNNLSQDTSTNIPNNPAPEVNSSISATNSSSQWKFVIRTAPRSAAEKRFQQLKSYGIPVQLQALDSTTSIVYLSLAVPVTDTARVKDSLRLYYASPVRIIR
ncbi:MAG: hypothetical protein ACO1NW_16930 [Chitinophagaceae bacterium]